jgi:hypothetical protein
LGLSPIQFFFFFFFFSTLFSSHPINFSLHPSSVLLTIDELTMLPLLNCLTFQLDFKFFLDSSRAALVRHHLFFIFCHSLFFLFLFCGTIAERRDREFLVAAWLEMAEAAVLGRHGCCYGMAEVRFTVAADEMWRVAAGQRGSYWPRR